MRNLPDYADHFLNMICKLLQEYRATCQSSYKSIVTDAEDKRVISATWAKDEDINRLLRYALSSAFTLSLHDQSSFLPWCSPGLCPTGRASKMRWKRISKARCQRRTWGLWTSKSPASWPATSLPLNPSFLRPRSSPMSGSCALLATSQRAWLVVHHLTLNLRTQASNWDCLPSGMVFQENRRPCGQPEGWEPAIHAPFSRGCKQTSPGRGAHSDCIRQHSAVSLHFHHHPQPFVNPWGDVQTFLSRTLGSLAQDFVDSSETCLLVLHLEVRVLCFYHLLPLAKQVSSLHCLISRLSVHLWLSFPFQSNYSGAIDDMDPDANVIKLNKWLNAAEEMLQQSLQPRRFRLLPLSLANHAFPPWLQPCSPCCSLQIRIWRTGSLSRLHLDQQYSVSTQNQWEWY